MRQPRRKKPTTLPGPLPRKAVIYARVSSKDQEESGFSIPAQLKAAHAYAVAQGLAIEHEFVEAQSAKATGRKQFNAMLEHLKSSKHPVAVIVEKTDRLYRNFRDLVTLDDLVTTYDIELHLFKESMVVSQKSTGHEMLVHNIKIVSQALFDQVQAIMDGRYGGVFETREFAFTGLLRCGYCGYKITAELKRKPSGKTYVYYHCRSAASAGRNAGSTWSSQSKEAEPCIQSRTQCCRQAA